MFFFVTLMLFSCQYNGSKNKKEFLSILNTNRIKVLVILSIDCPICKKYQGSFLPMIKKFKENVEFVFLFPNQTKDSVLLDYCNYDSLFFQQVRIMPLAEDFKFLKSWGITTTPQIVILNSDNIQVYSGKINNRFMSLGNEMPPSENYLEKVLTSLLKNEEIKIQNTEPIGCLIQY